MTEPKDSDTEENPDTESGGGATAADRGEIQPTPFDHPLFLPAMFVAGCAWFGYDAYLETDPDMLEHLEFNRFGLRVVAYAAAITGVHGWAELKERTVSPWSRVWVHALFTLWFGFDGWLNSDLWYAPYAEFNQMAAVALGATTLGLAVRAARFDPAQSDDAPGLWTALWILALATAFGVRVWLGVDNPLLFSSTAAGLGVMAIWMARRARRVTRRRSDANAAPSP